MLVFAYEAFTLFGDPFQDLWLTICLNSTPLKASFQTCKTYNAISKLESFNMVWAPPFSLAATKRIRDT